MESETHVLVRSFRESNLILLLGCLKEAAPQCCALDHIHFSRWLSVFTHDLELLRFENSDLFNSIGNNLVLGQGHPKQAFQRLPMIKSTRFFLLKTLKL